MVFCYSSQNGLRQMHLEKRAISVFKIVGNTWGLKSRIIHFREKHKRLVWIKQNLSYLDSVKCVCVCVCVHVFWERLSENTEFINFRWLKKPILWALLFKRKWVQMEARREERVNCRKRREVAQNSCGCKCDREEKWMRRNKIIHHACQLEIKELK